MATLFELKQQVGEMKNNLSVLENILQIEAKKARQKEIETQLGECWNDVKLCASLSKEKTMITNIINEFDGIKSDVNNINDLLELPESELDAGTIAEIEASANKLQNDLKRIRTKSLFNRANDSCNAFLEINSGAGGTESCDWAEMLLRMYTMWADKHNFKVEIIDKLDGEEAGIKSATLQISGDFAYGLLKNETGAHRLVRISPFNANGKRQTSFAGVYVYPEVNDDIEITINPADLRIDVYRSSGAGGQHVNKTESAVRITHIPTGIVCACQTQRSQFQNKDYAMKQLKSKLYERELEKQNAEKQAQEEAKTDISWGNQIRSYVLHPYKMVKDLRSNFDVGNAQAVLDGDLDDLIESVLLVRSGAR
ncbi:MAG: peptide chain release factor 2 [Rickettsiales bacterium]|nr:peptide chain release factor 2 [Rickettsiales bacterium]